MGMEKFTILYRKHLVSGRPEFGVKYYLSGVLYDTQEEADGANRTTGVHAPVGRTSSVISVNINV